MVAPPIALAGHKRLERLPRLDARVPRWTLNRLSLRPYPLCKGDNEPILVRPDGLPLLPSPPAAYPQRMRGFLKNIPGFGSALRKVPACTRFSNVPSWIRGTGETEPIISSQFFVAQTECHDGPWSLGPGLNRLQDLLITSRREPEPAEVE